MASSKSSKTKHKGKGMHKALHTAANATLATHGYQRTNDSITRDLAEKEHDHDDTNKNNVKPSGKQLSNTAVNIKRREDYANMDPASKDRERTRVKRSRAGKMARDSLPDTAWAELGRRAQVDVADAIADEIRFKYAATTPGPSSRTAAEYAVQKVFADKIHLFFPKEERKNHNRKDYCADDTDAMDVDSDNDAGADVSDTEKVDGWVPSELTRGWQCIAGDGIGSKKLICG
ncbi:hypothetical protein PG993_011533 [Apiospora rasikravindrae]|uniref:Uncharacterized protein n=1 Tax=Apiospora rasikravindrae TaxID=990691 RepID=A0ABR1SEI9_9PEZI